MKDLLQQEACQQLVGLPLLASCCRAAEKVRRERLCTGELEMDATIRPSMIATKSESNDAQVDD